MKEWIIIGGGIQGCTLATYLLEHGCTKVEDMQIIDPYREPLAQWKTYTKRIAMSNLRSPAVHHLAPNPYHITQFAKKNQWNNAFYGYYKKPNLEFFNHHSEDIIEQLQLHLAWKQGRVEDIERHNDQWIVSLESGDKIKAKNVAITAGFTEQLLVPEWAGELKQNYPHLVWHIFEKEEWDHAEIGGNVAVIGGGITGAHAAIKWSNLGKQVTLLIKNPLKIHEFDSDPGWLGPKNMTKYRKIDDYKQRRTLIKQARHKGSLPPNIYQKLMKYVQQGKVTIVEDTIQSAIIKQQQVQLQSESNSFQFNQVILATGFTSNIQEINWLQRIIKSEQLTCAHCGFPIVTRDLQWTKGLYVTGALAELEIGPTARNISGARTAAERIVKSVST
ncbi:NAD(P)-binding domain-containing protein [Mangrovibacillus cuniculi]|uniref:NAD(P)-binding domain-containing protein n=1 Tax=Mangrovibacillus cuniculi TaxID=2593652 RepID=A0A7S8C945_9BACI|nr:NAD(P)-binding domain-containing protein [Mangrovibacillus cuniculi]QPC45690.1 NAD(P)-binding domain-containing protein [Mangrovibacillus cuniculi]